MADSADGIVYVRLSLMKPKTGQESRVTDILNDLLSFYASQPGYLEGYSLSSKGRASETGRLTLWQSEEAAEHVANASHVLAQRAELLRLVEIGSHIERSFTAESHPAVEAAT